MVTTKTTEGKVGSHAKNIGKLINTWKRFFDDWAYDALAQNGFPYFKMGYMAFIMNISETGSTNNEIAAKAKVTKQAMSKVAKELVELGLVTSEKHETDARASVLFLTKKGKEFIAQTKKCVNELGEEYKEVVGAKNYEIMVNCILKINAYHEAKTQNKVLRVL